MSPEEREESPWVDFFRPIIADGDTGHGGLTAVMKLTKMFIEKGAAGVHFEDQKPGKEDSPSSPSLPFLFLELKIL